MEMRKLWKELGNMDKERIITVLFTRYHSIFSNIIYFIGGRGYTHVSIALDEKNEYYYSFSFKGFRKEYPKRHRKRSRKSISCKLEVSQKDYERMEWKLNEMEQHREQFHYSRLGVFFCLLRIPYQRENRYFCSQFVAEMLSMSGQVILKKEASLYFPNQLLCELGKQDSLKEIVCNPI